MDGPRLPTGFTCEAIVCDVDGVLTDGKIRCASDGTVTRAFCVRDGIGQKLLVAAGIRVGWLSATSERESIVLRARMVGMDESLVDAAPGDKGPRFDAMCARLGVVPQRVVFVGDDVNDLPAMERAGLAACPADAAPAVREAAGLVLRTPGGAGVLRELAELVLRA